MRDQLGQRVGDPLEQVVEALLGEDVVEDVRELAVGLDEALGPWVFGRTGGGVQVPVRVGSREQVPHPP